jgi:hypothetical protein
VYERALCVLAIIKMAAMENVEVISDVLSAAVICSIGNYFFNESLY